MTDDSPAPPAEAAAGTTLFLLHFLGGSARTWDAVADRLAGSVASHRIDLPGFGDAAHLDAQTVAEMADHVAALIRDAAPHRWVMAGHSMGAKIAAVVARRAESGEAGLEGLVGLVLVAGSPPSPEPMDEARRDTMLGWFSGDDAAKRDEASTFVDLNVGRSLDRKRHTEAVEDVIRMNRAAWQAWLMQGSREDWSAFVGTLSTPTLIAAGGEDGDLGPEAQRRLMMPHFEDARLVTLEGAGHLLPIERSGEIADLILAHVAQAGAADLEIPDPAYRALIRSDRVSARTRAILLDRGRRDDPARVPEVLSPEQFKVLRAVVDRILPRRRPMAIDLAARIDGGLARGEGDGWRFAALPPDAKAAAAGLGTLDALARDDHAAGFAELDAARADSLLRRIQSADIVPASDANLLSAAQMKLWFEDLLATAVRIYVSHPATLARMGYSGIANGGDGRRKQGFDETRADRPESWEPRGIAGRRL